MPLQLSDLFEASFKNVAFLSPSTTITGGRKDILHEFPNRDLQNIEDLGLRPRSFTITAIIAGDLYIVQRDRLLSKLEEGGTGVLVHPFFGTINNVVCRNYSLSQNETDLGIATFNIEFAVSNSTGLPVGSQSVISSIFNRTTEVFNNVFNLINNNFRVATNFIGNFNVAKLKILQVNAILDSAAQFLPADATKINDFNAISSAQKRNINSITVDPNALATSNNEIFTQFSTLFDGPIAQSGATAQIFNFGADDTIIVPSTAGLQQRKNNNDILNASTNTLALAISYQSAASIEFGNVNELNTQEQILEDQYQFIVDNPGLDDETLQSITDTRTETQSFFNDQRLTVSQIVDARTNTLPARVIAYQYYKDSSRGQEIIDLNDEPNVSFLQGAIEVLSK